MNYVIGGYSTALATVFVYGITLVLRRRRWERALKVAAGGASAVVPATGAPADPGTPGGRS